MSAVRPVIAIDVHVLGSTDALWCDRCLLPSISAHRVAIVDHDSLRVISRLTATVCDECGATGRTR